MANWLLERWFGIVLLLLAVSIIILATPIRPGLLGFVGWQLEGLFGMLPGPLTELAALGRITVIRWIVLILEMWLVLILLVFAISGITTGASITTWLDRMVIWISVISSLAMGVYMHTTFWGPLSVFGWFDVPALMPPRIDPYTIAYWIALPGSVYLLIQTIPLVARPSRSPWSVAIDLVSSTFPFAEVIVAVARYWRIGTPYDPTPLQQIAMMLWSVNVVTDMLYIVASGYLLFRMWGAAIETDERRI